ncbi:hypothetical protein [Candidatus Nitrospira bockiana]
MPWILALWLASISFRDVTDCMIQGYVYANPGEGPSFKRADGCADVKDDVQENVLILNTRHFWVRIVLPSTGGHQPFWYRWGSDHAQIETMSWPIAFGPIRSG